MNPIHHFERRSMQFKFTAVLISVVLIPMLILAFVSYKVIDSRLEKEAREKIAMGLKAAWTEYYTRGEQMRLGMLQAASMQEIKNAVAKRDGGYLKDKLVRWKQMRPYVDIWVVVDGNGHAITRLHSDLKGDLVGLNGLTMSALSSGEPRTSTEIINSQDIKSEGNELHEKIFHGQNSSRPHTEGDAKAMALVVVTPVLDSGNKPIGAIITGDVLTNDDYIPNAVAQKIPGMFTSISMEGKRVSTNLTDKKSGRSIRDSALPAGVTKGTDAGNSIFHEWEISDTHYLSVFEPIKDNAGKVIGTLDAGISKEALWAIQKENQRVIALITLLGIALSIGAAGVSARRITRPLKELKTTVNQFAGGNYNVNLEVDETPGSKNELNSLAKSFKKMVEEVRRKDEEKENFLSEIQKKNQELFILNEEMKSTNEELEVAYEETQSQTEELHAINEELRVLNEDLDMKNSELEKVNTKIKIEEEELRRAKDKLRLIYDSILDYILLVDYEHNVLEANRHFMDTFALDEPSLSGRKIYSVFDMKPPANCPIRSSIEKKNAVHLEMNTDNGHVLTIHSFPLIEEDGSTKSAVVYIKDITDQRNLMNRLIQSDKLSSLGELVSGVAHELNNPLTGVMCFSELLLESNFAEDVKLKLRKINEASHRCKKIIDNLLTFARWQRPEKKYISVNKVITESVELMAYQLNVDNIRLELDLDPKLPDTMVDENQMDQVMLNLISNARDAIMDKGEKGAITIRSRTSGSKIMIQVEDTGKGISNDLVDKIFDPFFTTKGVGKGTGLGLSISYGIVNEHGGNIYAMSKPGIGTTFVIEIPVIGKPGAVDKDRTGSEWASRIRKKATGLKALIVDDEAIVLDLLDDSLVKAGFEVHRCSNAEDALGKLAVNKYDIIISDIKMPGIDGKGFFTRVKQMDQASLKKIIFVSGDSINKETQDFLAESGNISLKKPFSVKELYEALLTII